MRHNHVLMRSWWIPGLRGLMAIALAVSALLVPDMTLLSLIAVFAVYALLAGTVAVVGAIRNRRRSSGWSLLLALGIAGMTAGVLAALHPAFAALAALLVIGINAIVNGVLDMLLAWRLRASPQGRWLLMLGGVISLLFGLLLTAYPGAGALVLLWLIGWYAFATGVAYLALAWRGYRDARLAPAPAAAAGAGGRHGVVRSGVERRVGERRNALRPAGH